MQRLLDKELKDAAIFLRRQLKGHDNSVQSAGAAEESRLLTSVSVRKVSRGIQWKQRKALKTVRKPFFHAISLSPGTGCHGAAAGWYIERMGILTAMPMKTEREFWKGCKPEFNK